MASGDTLLFIPVQLAENQSGCSYGRRNGTMYLAFDDTTDENCEFPCPLPQNYAGGGITAKVLWMSEDQTTGNCVWDLAWKSVTDDEDDLDSKAFATAQSVTATTASATGEVDYASITFTDGAQIDSAAAGEYCRLQLNRDANNGSDTLTNDAQLIGILIEET